MKPLSPDSQAILLLAGRFSSGRQRDFTPLTPTEYGRLARWLRDEGLTPKDLKERLDEVLGRWSDPKRKITEERLRYLMGRGGSMGIALEKWASAGIWILTRADAGYPSRLRKRLADQAPPLLFGVGEPSRLEKGGLAIVGSRNIEPEEEDYAKRVGAQAAREGLNVVSGGAKGVDELAMRAALDAEGTAIGVLASGVMKAALSGTWRPFLRRKDLCLVSPYYPDAGFQVGQAMGRNKYVYCLADYGLVVRADEGEGGTWSGAEEAIGKQLAPLFVNPHSTASGNRVLLKMGGMSLRLAEDSAQEQWLKIALESAQQAAEPDQPAEVAVVHPVEGDVFYGAFLQWMDAQLKSAGVITLRELESRHQDVTAPQLKKWLQRALDDREIERIGRAHRYRRKGAGGHQPGLFGDEKAES